MHTSNFLLPAGLVLVMGTPMAIKDALSWCNDTWWLDADRGDICEQKSTVEYVGRRSSTERDKMVVGCCGGTKGHGNNKAREGRG
jgi:hypothetical protein